MQQPHSSPDERPCLLHLHIPKTGGKTLVDLIYRYYSTYHASGTRYRAEGGYLIDGIYFYPRDIEAYAHHPAFETIDLVTPPEKAQHAMNRIDVRAVSGHFSFGIHRYIRRPTTYITVLREPVERVVSLYYFIQTKDIKRRVYELVRAGSVGLEAFVRDLDYKQADNGQTRRIAGLEPPFGACTSDMLETAKANLRDAFAAVGTLDRFDETLQVFARRLGWTSESGPIPSYELNNVNPNRPRLVDLPARTLDLIAEHNRLDAELYAYADELLNKAVGALPE